MTFPARVKTRKLLPGAAQISRPPRTDMKDPVEVLRRKEAELERLQEEVDALRLVGKLLSRQSAAVQQEPETRGKILQMP